MATFTFQVDRAHTLVRPLTFYTSLACTGEPVRLEPGQAVVYRGLVELDGKPRYTFDEGDRKLYTLDRGALEPALHEDYDAGVQI